jgi:hypothetical protein
MEGVGVLWGRVGVRKEGRVCMGNRMLNGSEEE